MLCVKREGEEEGVCFGDRGVAVCLMAMIVQVVNIYHTHSTLSQPVFVRTS